MTALWMQSRHRGAPSDFTEHFPQATLCAACFLIPSHQPCGVGTAVPPHWSKARWAPDASTSPQGQHATVLSPRMIVVSLYLPPSPGLFLMLAGTRTSPLPPKCGLAPGMGTCPLSLRRAVRRQELDCWGPRGASGSGPVCPTPQLPVPPPALEGLLEDWRGEVRERLGKP